MKVLQGVIFAADHGEWLDEVIAAALAAVARPGVAFAYVLHNGVLVTVDQASTPASVEAEHVRRLGIMLDVVAAEDDANQEAAKQCFRALRRIVRKKRLTTQRNNG